MGWFEKITPPPSYNEGRFYQQVEWNGGGGVDEIRIV